MSEIYNPDGWPVETGTVGSVDVYDDGGCSVTGKNSWSFFINADEIEAVGQPPVADESLVVLGGLGHQIRGIFIGGRQYRYTTREEADREREEWLSDHQRQKEESFYVNISEWLKRKNALDEPFRKRMDRFANKGFEEFWRESGAYELFTVEQANLLLNRAKARGENPVEWLEEFYDAKWEKQKEMFPGLDEGHSGNTFGGMVWLAKAVANGEDI